MAESSKPKRTYTSTRRKAQAEQTRRAIVESARKLFYEQGYASATIEAIAQQAGVSQETIYATFGSKQAILRRLVQVTLVGDEDPVPLLQRPHVLEANLITNQRVLIRKWAEDMDEIMTRMSPIFALLKSTAQSDPEIAAFRARILSDRLGGIGFFVSNVRRIGPLRAGLSEQQATASAWAISSAEVFDLLVRDQGWSHEQFVDWLSDAVERILLP